MVKGLEMTDSVSDEIRNLDFRFENSPVLIIANRNCPKIELPGLTVGPFEEGNEYEIEYWIAQQLVKSGIVRLRKEEKLRKTKLYKVQWKERVQSARNMAKLPEDFYPKLRRYLKKVREETNRNFEKTPEYKKVRQITKDIINSRLKKIVSLASASTQTHQILKSLTKEERLLYDKIHKFISQWRAEILEMEGNR